jgi:uncharacterized protein YggE
MNTLIRNRISPLGCSLLLSMLLASGCADAAQTGNPMGIHVSGQGTIEVAPDMGRVQLHVRREGAEADALTTDLNQVVTKIIGLAQGLGIEERDIQATSLSITPRYQRRGNETVVDGLVATRSIELVLRDLDVFGELLSAALASGANNVDPMRLDSARRSSLEDEALALAMEDAKAEAAKVAAGFGVALGPVTDVQVGMHSPRPEALRAVSYSDSGPAFSAGVIRIQRSVSATFSILQSR